jgi:Major Facilitator Superfamily
VTRATLLALVAMALAVFVIANDVTALSVALPSIERDFNADVSSVQWVINAYALVFGVLIVTGGRLADLLGRRRIFLLGACCVRRVLAAGGGRAERAVADRLPRADGDRRSDDVARDPRDDYGILPKEKAGLAGGLRPSGAPAPARSSRPT